MQSNHLPVLVIPAYNPDEKLIALLHQHKAIMSNQHGIVVNDGSDPACLPIFSALEKVGYIVLHHKTNQGKGAALKTAMHYFLNYFSESSPGIITADADGQHCVEDIKRLTQCFQTMPNKLHLGVRAMDKSNVPFRSRFGNTVTRYLFNFLTRNTVIDTQTGLRAIPTQLMPQLIKIHANRYEFEFEMFFIAKKNKIKIAQLPIETIYIDNNKGSHFNPILDSLRVYFVFLRFSASAALSFLMDFSLFSLTYYFTGKSAMAVFSARCISAPFNFFLNKKVSFQSKEKLSSTALKYVLLVLVIAGSSYQLMLLIHKMGFNMYYSKIVAETLIFIANFFIQKHIIFMRAIEE